ncbi:hypothetical protein LTS10_011866 [Elasticomyces elasticus]|nr:hypothetical protein LTS10_011866 [Elasticomyces elasticus]
MTSQINTPLQPDNCHLLMISAELRLRIYDFVYGPTNSRIRISLVGDDIEELNEAQTCRAVPAYKASLQTCQLINQEATPEMYKAVTVEVDIYPQRVCRVDEGISTVEGGNGMPFLDEIEKIPEMNVMCFSADSVVSVAHRTTQYVKMLRRSAEEKKVSVSETEVHIGASMPEGDAKTVTNALLGLDCKGGVTVTRSEFDEAKIRERETTQKSLLVEAGRSVHPTPSAQIRHDITGRLIVRPSRGRIAIMASSMAHILAHLAAVPRTADDALISIDVASTHPR